MKWIGQKIHNFISRFRNDVYLEDISTGTIASGGNLGLDSNNKIVKATEATGDITGVDLTGAAPITISSETGTTSGNYSATIEVNAANVSSRGVVELATTAETTTGTDANRAVTPDGLKDGYQGSANVTTLGTIGTGVWQGTAIAHAYIGTDAIETDNIADAQVTVAKLHADAIQTSGESFADNDTSLMTSAAIDDKINTKYAYTYMTFSASAVPTNSGSDPEWMFPNPTKGIYEEDWNSDSGITSTTLENSTAVGKNHAVNSIPLPHAGVLVGFHAIGRNDDSNLSFKAGLFHSSGAGTGDGIDWGNSSINHEFTLECIATADTSGGVSGSSNFKGPCKLVSNTVNKTIAAGDTILPAIMATADNATDEIFVTWTIILKIPLTI